MNVVIRDVTTAGHVIGPGQACRIVAEISNAHNGSLDLAKRLIRECAEAGADFVKFQCYTPDELVLLRGDGPAPEPWGSQGWRMADLYQKARTPHEWFPELVDLCRELRMPWFSSVFGETSLALLESLDCPAYKFAALDVGSVIADQLAHEVKHSACKPVIASSRNGRVPWADLTLWCPPGYPQDWGAFRWPDEGHLKMGLDGLSYHGKSVHAPAIAVENGAKMVEVHVQLDDVPSELEAGVSLTISQLKQLCEARVAA